MDEHRMFEQLNIQAEEVFKQATFEEFFGNHLFKASKQDYYLFTQDERGDSVWLVERQREQVEALRIEEARKFPPQPMVPRPCSFSHCEPINDTWLQDRRVTDIEDKLRQGGKLLGRKANKAFVDVLRASVSGGNAIQAQDGRLDEVLAGLFSKMVQSGFRPDRFIFPEHLEARLVQTGIIVRDKEIQNSHYVGQTTSGQRAFWSEDLPRGTILVFDSRNGIVLTRESRFSIVTMRPFTPGVCGYLGLNPIVKNTQGVFAIEGVDQMVASRINITSPTQPASQVEYKDVLNTGQRWAVLVGVNEYEDKAHYGQLQVCVKDAEALQQQLIVGGYDPRRIRLLSDQTNELPTRRNILAALKSVCDATEPDDLILFYYSGHGEEEEGESYLVARDGQRLIMRDTAVSVSRVKELMEKAPARAKVLLLDACHSGANIDGKGPKPMSAEFIDRVFFQAEGLAILASCKQGQFSYEWRAQERSVFTHFLLEALTGKADRDDKGFVSVQDANRYVVDGVKLWSSQNNVSQTPTLQYAVAGDIVLVRSSESASSQPPVAASPLIPMPRIKRKLTDKQRVEFPYQAFEVIRSYLANALKQLSTLNPDIETTLRPITNTEFVCEVYLNGKLKSNCRVWISGDRLRGNNINYSEGDLALEADNSFDESLHVEDDGVEIYLRAWMSIDYGYTHNKLTPDQAAAYLWERLTRSLEY